MTAVLAHVDVHVGFSPTLREEVAKAVKRLLARQ
jgi:hypothetical protein